MILVVREISQVVVSIYQVACYKFVCSVVNLWKKLKILKFQSNYFKANFEKELSMPSCKIKLNQQNISK